MIEPDINEQMARFAPSQNPADPGFDAIERAVAGMSGVPMPKPEPVDINIDRAVQDIAAQRRQDMASSLMAASEVNPDEAAQADALGRRFGVGQDIALRNMAEMRRQAMIQDTERMDLLRKDPVLARYIADREFAAQASDDVGILAKLQPLVFEAAMLQTPGGFFRVVGRGYERGRAISERGDIGARVMAGFAGQADLDRAKQLTEEMQALGQQGILGSTAEMIAQNVGQLRTIGTTTVAGAAAGGILGPAGAVAGGAIGATAGIVASTGTMEAGNLYLDMREQGVSDDAAIPAAVAGGFLNGVIEAVGMKIAAKPFRALASKIIREEVTKAVRQPTMRAALAAGARAYGLQVGTEATEEGLQEIVAVASEEIAKAADGIDSETSLRDAAGRVIEAFAYGGMAASLLGGVGPGANLVVDLRRASATQRQQAFFDGLVENRKESKLAQRNPQGYERFLAAQAKDTTAETIYVDAATARDVLAQSGTTTAQLEEILPGIRERLEKAVETGGDVTIPTSQFGARLANTELGNALLPHMRLAPDAMSATEAQAFEAQRQAVVEEARTILAAKQDADAAFVAEAQQVEDEAFEQVRSVGQFTDIEARTIAKLRQAMVVVDAAEAGMTPAQYQRERGVPLQVRGVQAVQEGQPLEQPAQMTLADVEQSFADLGVEQRLTETATTIRPGIIRVPAELRDEGRATRAMQSLIAYADQSGKRIDVSPTGEFGASKKRLIAWYKRLGFVENKGANKDFAISATMYRLPSAPVLEQAARIDADYLASVERGDMDTAQRMVDDVVERWIGASVDAGNSIMPSSGTTYGNVSLPLYRYVDGDKLTSPERGMHWTHSRKDVEDMASSSAGFLIVAKHPGLDRVLSWESLDDRPMMEREIGGYEYRDRVFPEVPIRPGQMDIVYIIRVDSDGKRTIIKSADPVTRDEAGNVIPLSRRFDITSPRIFEQAAVPAQINAQHREAIKAGDVATAQALTDAAAEERMPDSQVRDADGKIMRVFHGTQRIDRVGNRLLKKRATSGPMPFFTNTRPIAEGYAQGKEDTSIEDIGYEQWIKYKPKGSRSRVTLDQAWLYLTPEQRATATDRLFTVGYQNPDEGTGPIVADTDTIASRDHVQYLLREARGNALTAAKELWLNSGSLFNDEQQFMDVLKGMGLTEGFVYDSPHAVNSGIIEAYINITNPLDTAAVPESVVDALQQRANRIRKPAAQYGRDAWDKEVREPQAWMQRLRDDIREGQTQAWTSIPDWVTDVLRRLGYDGIKDTGGKFGGESHTVWIPFEPEQVKFANAITKDASGRLIPLSERFDLTSPMMYRQEAATLGPRGGFDPRTLNVLVGKGGDVSTLAHELIHLRVAEYLRMARGTTPPARVNADLETLFGFMGVEGATFQERLDNYETMTIDQRRPLEEKVTYNFEIYLYDGKAPSVELRGVFERLSAWMRRVYKSIRDDLNAIYRREFGTDLPILTPEVRSVFDRMLASEEQIKRQEAINGMKGLFQTQAESGMDDAEWAAYQAMQQEATEAAVTDLNTASMRQLQWLGNARARILRDLQKKHDAKRKEVTAEVAAAIKVEPVYRAMTYLRYGRFVDTDGAEVEVEGTHRLDIEKVRAMYASLPSAEGVELIRATGMAVPANVRPDITPLGTGKYGMLGRDGLDPDMVAEMFGYSSGDEMVRAMLAAKPMKEAVAERTDAEMLRRYGDMNTPEALEAEVQKALHNEARARFVAVELRHIAKATQPVRVMLETARQVAADMISDTTIRDLRPGEFVAAEARAARDAERIQRTYGITEPAPELAQRYGTDRQQALIRAKRAQLYQNQLAAEALRVKEYVDKQVKYLRGVMRDSNVKRMGAAAADQVRAILDNYSLVSMTRAQREQVTDLRNWLAAEEANGTLVDIDPALGDSARRKNYTELTVAEFRDLVDSVKQIEHRGKNERNIYLAGEKVEFESRRDELVAHATEVAEKKGRKVRKDLGDEDRKWMNSIASYDASQQTIGNIVYVLDGGKRDGPLARWLLLPANNAGNQEATDRAVVSEKVNDIVGPLAQKGQFAASKMHFPHIGESLSLEQRMVIALNYGNQSNIDRLLNGEQWTAEQARIIIESLTEEQLNAVQGIWDVMSSFRDRVAEKSRRLTGKEPRWLEPLPLRVTSADGKIVELRGGYYPAKYNPRRSVGARELDIAADAERLQREAYTATTTSRSFEKNRSDRPPVDQVLSRQFVAMYAGLNEVIHDLAWHDFAISATRLLRDKAFQRVIKERYGLETYNAIKDWVDVVVAGDRTKYDAFEQVAIFARQNVSVSAMGIRLMTAAVQPTGIFPAMTRTGVGPMVRAIAEFAYSPVQTSRNVIARSSFMQNRGRTRFRDLNEIANIVQEQSRFQRVRRTYIASAYVLTSFMQGLVDTSVWMAAYSNAVKAGKSERDAVFIADQTVVDTQGSGRVQDLSSAMRGGKKQSAYAKLFTPFYQYSNTMYSLFGAQMRTAPTYGKAAKDAFLILTVGAIVEELIRYALKPSQEEPEPEELVKKLAANQIDFVVGLPFGLREFRGAGSLIMGTDDGVQSYRGPSGLRIVTDATQAAVQARQGEFDAAFRRAVINLLGTTAGIPSAQINDTINGIEAVVEGEVEGAEAVLAPVTGVQR